MTVSLLEEMLDQTPYTVLSLHIVTGSLLFLERILEILFLTDGITHGVKETKGEVTDYPEELRKILSYFVWVALTDHV